MCPARDDAPRQSVVGALGSHGSILRAKRRFESTVVQRGERRREGATHQQGDPDDPEDPSWKKAIEDEQKMFMLAQELWLSLSHCGEACLRVAVELICDRKARKVALRRELDDSTKKELNALSKSKLKVVSAQLRPGAGGADAAKMAETELQMKKQKEADDKEIQRLKELIEQNKAQVESAQQMVLQEREMREKMARDAAELEEGRMAGMRNLQAQLKQAKSSSGTVDTGADDVKNVELERDLARQKLSDLQIKMEELMKENKQLKKACDEAQNKQGDSADAAASNQAFIDDLKTQSASLQDQIKTHLTEKEALEKKVFNLEKDLRQAKDDLKSASSKDDKSGKLIRERDAAQEETRKCSEQIRSLEKECTEVTEKLQSRIKQTTELSGQVEDLKSEIDSLRIQLAEGAAAPQPIYTPDVSSDELKAAVAAERKKCEAQLADERRKWARERTRLVEENAEKQEKEHHLQSALEELRGRLRKFSELAAEGNISSEVKELLNQAGLDEIVKGHEGPVKVWDRLYNDFWERMKKLESARQKVHDANMLLLQEQQALIWNPNNHRQPPIKLGDMNAGSGGVAFGRTVSPPAHRSSPRRISPRDELLRFGAAAMPRGPSPHDFRGPHSGGVIPSGALQNWQRRFGPHVPFDVHAAHAIMDDGLDHADPLELAGMGLLGSRDQSPPQHQSFEDYQRMQGLRANHRDPSPRRNQRSPSPSRPRDPSPAAEGGDRLTLAGIASAKIMASERAMASPPGRYTTALVQQRNRFDSDQDLDARNFVETSSPAHRSPDPHQTFPAITTFTAELDREWAPAGAMLRTCSLPALTGHSLHAVGAGGSSFGGRDREGKGNTNQGRAAAGPSLDEQRGNDADFEKVARQSWGSDTAEVVRNAEPNNPPRRKPRRAHNTNYLYPSSNSRVNDPALTATALGVQASGVAQGIERATDGVVWLIHQ